MTDKDGNVKNIIVVNCEKDLGIHVQDNLKFDMHISIASIELTDSSASLSVHSHIWMKKHY